MVKAETVKKITLISGYDDKSQLADIAQKLDDLKQSLLELDIELEVSFNPNMHDWEIQIDNGWSSRLDWGSISFNGQKAGSESEQTI